MFRFPISLSPINLSDKPTASEEASTSVHSCAVLLFLAAKAFMIGVLAAAIASPSFGGVALGVPPPSMTTL